MNSDQIKGNWMQLKGLVRERWGKLTDDELDQIEGNRERLLGKIQERYGAAREEIEDQIEELFEDFEREEQSIRRMRS